MNDRIKQFKNWFEERDLRERLLVASLFWAISYAFFSLFLFSSIDAERKELASSIKQSRDKISNWKLQLDYLKKIPETPLYKEWVSHNQNYENLKRTYKDILGKPVAEQWKEIMKSVLRNHPNIRVDQVKSSPETVYQPSTTSDQRGAIYQEQMQLSVFGSFNDVVNYLQILENGLPNIYWNTLNYQVEDYPMAKVDMEFSVLYEKIE